MFEASLRRLIDPPLNQAAAQLARLGVRADWLTFAGLAAAIAAMLLISREYYWIALVFIVLNRLCDGLDGAVARLTHPTALGGYLDSVFDFVFYSAIPFGFALADPSRALAAAFLIFGFIATGATFLSHAMFVARSGAAQKAGPVSGMSGVTEGAAVFVAFALACLFPDWFSVIAYLFGIFCFVVAGMRIAAAVAGLRTS
ncbi:MAG: CDP-alcohol phosphatidyltransferase family protein [Proteobacteria bacterium]|nr:CDP-alcohol phosphatidyltransferase family protein [Pseudomonadota bacterium]